MLAATGQCIIGLSREIQVAVATSDTSSRCTVVHAYAPRLLVLAPGHPVEADARR